MVIAKHVRVSHTHSSRQFRFRCRIENNLNIRHFYKLVDKKNRGEWKLGRPIRFSLIPDMFRPLVLVVVVSVYCNTLSATPSPVLSQFQLKWNQQREKKGDSELTISTVYCKNGSTPCPPLLPFAHTNDIMQTK